MPIDVRQQDLIDQFVRIFNIAGDSLRSWQIDISVEANPNEVELKQIRDLCQEAVSWAGQRIT